jgi:alpha-mannosidase
MSILDAQSEPLPCQAVGSEVLLSAALPPAGYAVYRLSSEESGQQDDPEAPRAMAPSRPDQPFLLENKFFRISVSPNSTAITSIYDKRLGRELVSPTEPANLFQVCYEKPHGMSAWKIGPIAREENLLDGGKTEVLSQGNVTAALEVTMPFGSSNLIQRIEISRDIPRIDFATRIDWREVGGPDRDSPMLKVAFPFAHSSDHCVREVPFGHAEYPTDGREVPSLTFLELPGRGFGVAILNDSKYGHDARGNRIRLTLLRAAYDPDPLPDIGVHEIRYSILPHSGDWKEAEVWKRGHEFNSRVHSTPCGPDEGGISFLRLEGPGVDMACLKMADDGRGIVLRLVEMRGRSVDVRVRVGWRARLARKCDLRERDLGTVETGIEDGLLVLHLGPNEIGTWRIE